MEARDLTPYADAKATPTMEAFADFLIAEVYGGALPDGIDPDSFRKGVALGGSTRMYFQKSDFWKNDSRNYLANVEANRAAKAEAKLAAARAAEAKLAARIAKAEAALEAAKAKAEAARAEAVEDAPEAVEDAPESDAPADAPSGLADGPEALAAKAEAEADAPRRSRRGGRRAA